MADSIWHSINEYPQGEEEFIPCLVDYGDYIDFNKRFGVRNFCTEEKRWFDEDTYGFSDDFRDVQRWAYIKDVI